MQSRNDSPNLDYITRTFVREPDYIAAMRNAGERRRPGMQIGAYEGALLAWLVQISGAVRVLEIGTFMGYSTLWMASALPEFGHITTLEADAQHAVQARQHFANSPHAAHIELVQGAALDWLQAQPPEPCYDLVFIDADKQNYANYLKAVLPLLRPRGWIIGDNTLLFGALDGISEREISDSSKRAMAAFNETLADPSRFEAMLLPTVEGLTVARLK